MEKYISRTFEKFKELFTLYKSHRPMQYGVIIIYLILFNFWEEISTLLYGSEFVDITLIINYLGIGSIIYFSSQLLLEYLKGIGKELYASIPHFISIVIQLIFLDFFYGEINILKITYIYCISFIVSSLILVIIFLRVRDDRN